MFIVYKTTCLVNNKIYIGVHETKNPDIFDGYIGSSINIYNYRWALDHPKFPFHYAVIKYGINNFKRETLFQFTNKKEAYEKEAEIVTEEFIKLDNNYNICVGGDSPKTKSYKIYQFDYNGNFVREYDQIILAAKLNNIRYNAILYAIENKKGTHGFYWSTDAKIDITEYSYKKYLKYYIYDQQGNFIQEFKDVESIKQFLNNNSGNLSKSVKTSIKISGYFITTTKLEKLQITVTKVSEKLNRYTLDGKYIDSFNTIKEAKEKLNLKLCNISKAIKLGRSCNGYRWTRTNNPTSIININKK